MTSPLRHTFLALTLLVSILGILPAQSTPGITFLAQKDDYSAAGYNDVWGYVAPDGREYALLGVRTGTSIIDITDTQTLTECAFIPSTTSSWKDIKTYRNYAYVVTEHGPGLQVIDLSSLPTTATLVNTVTSFMGTAFVSSHNLYVDTARALLYMEGTSLQPVRLWSLADPANPVGVSSFGPSGQQVHDIYARGDVAYVSEGADGDFGIYDVSNPALPALLKRFKTPSLGYAHNAWLSDDGTHLMTTEETPQRTVKYWDISDLDSIRLRGQYLGSTELAHNTHIKGNYAYISHYAGGLKILDLSNPDQLTEVAEYGTYLGTPSSDYVGAWGAFPFFPSGKVLISDMQRGLFVLYFAPAVVTKVGEHPSSGPVTFDLQQNYPNPFNPSTTIAFGLQHPSDVRLTVHDLLGREIAVLISRPYAAGSYTVSWDAGMLPSGTYLYTLRTGHGTISRRMMLAR